MNWKQLYTSATPEERYRILLRLSHAVHHRRARLVLVRGLLRRDRRHSLNQVIVLNDRRQSNPPNVYLWVIFMFILSLMFLTVSMISIQNIYSGGAWLMLGFDLVLFLMGTALQKFNRARSLI